MMKVKLSLADLARNQKKMVKMAVSKALKEPTIAITDLEYSNFKGTVDEKQGTSESSCDGKIIKAYYGDPPKAYPTGKFSIAFRITREQELVVDRFDFSARP
jgi:hypothetical protein